VLGVAPSLVREKALTLLAEVPFSDAAEDSAKLVLALLAAEDDLFDLLPVHFVPEDGGARGSGVTYEQLFSLCVAGKLLYARARWLDGILDDYERFEDRRILYAVNEVLTERIHTIFLQAFERRESKIVHILRVLSTLYGRHSLSLALDAASAGPSAGSLSFDDYVTHSKARAAPVRAPVDATLLLMDAPAHTLSKARDSFECFAVGLQLYDDALDLEEDFREDRLSWLVCQTLRSMESQKMPPAGDRPVSDAFYEAALTEGALSDNLAKAERFFEISRELAKPLFTRWAERSETLISKARTLRKDYEDLVSVHHTTNL
jgi:hypothetical protein